MILPATTDARILIIDDQQANIFLLEGILQEGGYTKFRSVSDSRQAMQVFKEYKPDLILLDLMMPFVDGFELMAQLRRQQEIRSYLPILVLTADANPDTKRRALASGAKDFLAKPLDAMEVLLRIRNMLETRLLYRQQEEQASRRIQEQAALIDRATDAILVLELDDRITFWNKGATVLYGWAEDEAIGLHVSDLIYRQEPPDLEKANRSLLETGKWAGELAQVTRDGRSILVASRWTLVNTETGMPQSKLVINTDITEKKKLEAQLIRTQRLENIGLLAGGIAHDLNNVLAPILMGVELLKMHPNVPPRPSILETLHSSARRGADMVKQILAFARGGEGSPRPMQLGPVVGELHKMASQTFPRSITIDMDLPADLWPVHADATQIHQVLLNLCINARDAMPQGGRLVLSGQNLSVEPSAGLARDGKPGSYVRLRVTDTGAGIAPDVLAHIFDPFFTTKPAEKGTGLGLAMVQGIVRNHGGFVRVSSEPSKGSCFDVYLPALVGGVSGVLEGSRPELPTGRGELILVVDDEAALRSMASFVLEAAGYRVMTARDGAQATEIYQQFKDEIQVVFADATMPVMDGATLIRNLLEVKPNLKIIAASGTEPAGLPVQGFLPKPYSAEQLLTALRNVLSSNS